MKKFALVGAFAALTITIAGCGGGGSDTLTDREYTSALDDICASVNEDLGKLDPPADETDYKGYEDLADDAGKIIQDNLDQLNDLKPPKDLESDHKDLVASVEDTLDATDDLKSAAADEDDDALADAQQALQDAEDDRTSIAEDIGADGCAGSDEGDRLTADEYAGALEGLCATVDAGIAELDTPSDDSDYEGLAALADGATEIVSDNLDQLNELVPPEELQSDHDDYVASVEQTLAMTADLKNGAVDEDDDAINAALEALQDEVDTRDAIADRIGADGCVDTSDDPTPTTDDVPTTEDVPTTDAPAHTTPRITVPPVEMTIPADTEAPVEGTTIDTFDFDNLATPAGYVWENIDSESLAGIQDDFGALFEGQIAAIGGAFVDDSTIGTEFKAFAFFWNEEDIVSTGTGDSFLATFTDSAVSSSDEITTGGYPVTIWTDSDGAEGVGVIDSNVAMVLYGDPGNTQVMLDFFDAFIAANG